MTQVAIQGERGAFSHVAARQLFGSEAGIVVCRGFDELFDAVERGNAERGMVPVENTLAGAVQHSMDLLVERSLHAVAETRVAVRLCLAVPPGRTLDQVRSAASHPVALQQCRGFFRGHPDIEAKVAYDTAGSVRDLMEGRAGYDAAIASVLAAELYGAQVLLAGLEDEPENATRFLAVATDPGTPPEEGCKTSVAFTVAHRPGSLHRALARLAEADIDLTRLESRPIPGRPWEYRFYADLRGPSASRQDAALEALGAETLEVRVLGRYAEAPA